MNNVIKELNREVNEYELLFQENFDEVRNDIDFHIEKLEELIKFADSALDKFSEEISKWAEIIQELYLDYEADTIFEKIELARLKRMANRKYAYFLDLSYETGEAKQRLEAILKRLTLLKVFR